MPRALGGPARDDVLLYAPPVLLLIALIGIRVGGFYFKPAEIQFLFPAPISRTQLLIYNVLSRLQIAFLSAIWVSIFAVRHAPTWYGGFLAVFALLSFNQLTAQLGGIWAATSISNGSSVVSRWLRWLLVVILVVGGVVYTLPSLPSEFGEAARMFAAHPLIRGASWLTRPFVELFLATSPVEVALWSGVASLIHLVEVAVMLRIDGAYLETLTPSSNPSRSGRRRVRPTFPSKRGDTLTSRFGIRIPILAFPYLRGAGPIAWRQCQELLRNPAGLLRGGLGLLAVLPIVAIRASNTEASGGLGVASVAAAFLMIPMMVDGADFRRDLDRMAVLKTLPLRARIVALGQILPTALLLAFWMMLGALLILGVLGNMTLWTLYFLVLLIPPIALITAAVDNWLFLLMPYRIRTRDPGESTFVGRITIVMTVKMIALLLSISLGIGAAILSWRLVAQSVVLSGLVAFATLALFCIPTIGAVARAFRDFDVADGEPE